MAESSLHAIRKKNRFPCKNRIGIKKYSSADPRIWANDIHQKFIGLKETLKCNDLNQFLQSNNPEINQLMEEIKAKDNELDKIHKMYKVLSQKLRDLEDPYGKKFKIKSSDFKDLKLSDDVTVENSDESNSVKKRAEKYEEIIKERDELKQELSKLANVDDLLKNLKNRAEEADKMEQELKNLKNDLQKCGHGGSGDKLTIEPTRVNSDSKCNKCQKYAAELKQSSSMLELQERKLYEIKAERNFLLQRAEMIRCMEAELLLYKTKFEECECKMLNLKEIVVKAELYEKKLRESQCKLKTMEFHLKESEQQNENLIDKIEQLDQDLKERDTYIECLNQRIKPHECGQPKGAVGCEELIPGKVQSIVKQLSKEPSNKVSHCKCNLDSCRCASLPCSDSKVTNRNECKENLIKNVSYISNCSNDSLGNDMKSITMSEAERLKAELSCDEIRQLRQQNEAFDKEIRRLKQQLACVSQLLEDIEKERSSNCDLESEINELKKRHSQEMDEVNSSHRTSLCQKLNEIESMEQKLACQIEQRCNLENKLQESNEKLEEMKKYQDHNEEISKSYDTLEACHKERLKEMETLKCQYQKVQEENRGLNRRIQQLTCELGTLKDIKRKNQFEKNSSKEQRDIIKNSVLELKKFYDEKAFMIKCYEKKIRILETENENLKSNRESKYIPVQDNTVEFVTDGCFSPKNNLFTKLSNFGIDSLNIDELTEVHDRVRCAMMKLTNKDSHMDIAEKYSKMLDDICQKYNITLSKELILDNFPVRDKKDIDVCSTVTFPNTRQHKKPKIHSKRSKSSEFTKKSNK